MRRILFILGFVIASVCPSMAQQYDTMDLLVGGKLGAGMSNMTSVDADVQVFPYAGIYGELYVGKNMSMSLEVAYAHKGANNVNNVADYNIHYINTSYLFKYFPVKNLGIYTGLSLGRQIGARMKAQGSSVSISDDVKRGDFSIPVGLEYTFGRNWTVDARWHWSPGKIAKSDAQKTILGNAHNQLISLTVGYKFLVF